MVLAALLLLAGLKDAPVEGSMAASKSSGCFHVPANAAARVALLGVGPAAGAGPLMGADGGAAAGATTEFITWENKVRLPVEIPILFSLRSTLRLERA
jgi:hypothetical protein